MQTEVIDSSDEDADYALAQAKADQEDDLASQELRQELSLLSGDELLTRAKATDLNPKAPKRAKGQESPF